MEETAVIKETDVIKSYQKQPEFKKLLLLVNDLLPKTRINQILQRSA